MLLGISLKWEESVPFNFFIVFIVKISLSSILATLNKQGTLQMARIIVTTYVISFIAWKNSYDQFAILCKKTIIFSHTINNIVLSISYRTEFDNSNLLLIYIHDRYLTYIILMVSTTKVAMHQLSTLDF